MDGIRPGRSPARLVVWLASLLLLPIAAAALAAPQAIGIAAAVVNDVGIKSAGAQQFRKAAVRQRVALADLVRTGNRSGLQLVLLDKTKVNIGANALLSIDRFVYDPNGGSLSASVTKGAFRFMSGRANARKDVSIHSPSASIGIRGTILDGAVGEEAVAIARHEGAIAGGIPGDPATATLVVLRGPGPRTMGNVGVGAVSLSAGGMTVKLDRPLQAAYVPRPGAPPIGPFTISRAGLAALEAMVMAPQLPPPVPPVPVASPVPTAPVASVPPPGSSGSVGDFFGGLLDALGNQGSRMPQTSDGTEVPQPPYAPGPPPQDWYPQDRNPPDQPPQGEVPQDANPAYETPPVQFPQDDGATSPGPVPDRYAETPPDRTYAETPPETVPVEPLP